MNHQTVPAPFDHLTYPYYLAHCAISPISDPVRTAMGASMEHFARQGVVGYSEVASAREGTKDALSRLFGGESSSYAFVPNTSHGINHIAQGLNWRLNERIVLVKDEFPSNIRPWLDAAQRHHLQVNWLDVAPTDDASCVDLDRLESLLRGGVRLVAMSAVQFQSGLRMPLTQIQSLCAQYETLLFVDAIQACGAVPFRGADLDFWVSGGHKWMMGPEGTGFLYVNPKVLPHLNPVFVGWLSLQNPLNFLFDGPGLLDYQRPLASTSSRFELGTHNTAGLSGLKQACLELERVGIESVFDHIQSYFDLIEPRLEAIGLRSQRAKQSVNRSTILSFQTEPGVSLSKITQEALESRIVLTAPDGHLRIAPHYWNPLDQVDYVVSHLTRIISP
jgi:cysteine desulfurase / selenocysteine lyase